MRKITKVVTIVLTVVTIATIIYTAMALKEKMKPRLVPELELRATKLTAEPDKYINLTEPDQYVKEAIANPGEFIPVYNATDVRTLLDLMDEYDTHNVKVDNKFYKIMVGWGDYLPSPEMSDFLPLIFVCFLWVTFAICLKGKSLTAPEIKDPHS